MKTLSSQVLQMLLDGISPKQIIKETGCCKSLPYVIAGRNDLKLCKNRIKSIQKWAKTHSMESTMKKFNCTKDQYWSYVSRGNK